MVHSFTLGASEEVHQTERGSRPGSPLADVALNSLMALVMREMQLKFDLDLPLQSAFAALASVLCLLLGSMTWQSLWPPCTPTNWKAPLAGFLQAPFRYVLRLVCFSTSSRTKLKLSWLLVALMPRLVDSLAFWIILPRFRFQIVLSLFAVFRNTNIWVYMFQADGGLQSEIRHHVAKAQLAHRQVRRTHHPHEIHEQVHFSSSTASAFGGSDSAGAVAWCWKLGTADYSTASQVASCSNALDSLHCGQWLRADDQVPDVQLQLYWSMPSVALRLAKLRLLYAFHLFGDAPGHIIDMVTAAVAVAELPRSWFVAFRQALSWANTIEPTLFPGDPAPASTEHLVQWMRFIVMMVLDVSVVFTNELKLRVLSLGRFGLRTIV